MRTIPCQAVTRAIAEMSQQANCDLPADVLAALVAARDAETHPPARETLDQLVTNAGIALRDHMPICQDCGLAVVFADLGRDARLDGDLTEAINEGVREGYAAGYLRRSVLADPLDRGSNTGDNTPAIIHLRLVEGDRLHLTIAPKGGGSENMSAVWMMSPSEGRAGVIRRITERIHEAGGKPCPPLILGVGLGGNLEMSAILAKRALLRRVGEPSPLPEVADLEAELLREVNATGVGPMGLGGACTALAVHVERHPCHIASLPLALNVQCHAARHLSCDL